MIQVGIIGATGYTGGELIRILQDHPNVEITLITSQTYAGQAISDIYGNLRGSCDLICQDIGIEQASEQCDVLFLALPHGIASHHVTGQILKNCRIVDLGADYRLQDPAIYTTWYHTEHGSPELLDQAVYGLCEWERSTIAQRRLIANPGCYTTCSILSLAPLVKEGLIELDTIIIDAKSGVSGAGRKASQGTHYAACNESIKAYAVASHRHTPEIEEQLSTVAGSPITISFTPHLVPMNRGILTTAYASLKGGVTADEVTAAYRKYYGNERFIRLLPYGVFPETRWVKGSNMCDIGLVIDERTGRIIVGGAIDNLIKGASGQAIQNMNILFGLPEDTGLHQVAGFPY
jgi:N-acetyl-gamma-glutamyl-phosphate reductase